jgi:hypothetical protein
MGKPRRRSNDTRAYVKVAIDIADHPKIIALDDAGAAWAYIAALVYCGQHLTDGVFPVAVIARKPLITRQKVAKLFAGKTSMQLAHRQGHDCPTCTADLGPGDAVIHDYLELQTSRADVEELRGQRAAAGAKGAASRWRTDRDPDGNSDGKSHSRDMASAMASAIDTDGKSHGNRDGKRMAEGEVEGEVEGGVVASRGHTRAGAREASPTPPTPIHRAKTKSNSSDGAPLAPCGTHPDDDRPCHRCRDIRLAANPRAHTANRHRQD